MTPAAPQCIAAAVFATIAAFTLGSCGSGSEDDSGDSPSPKAAGATAAESRAPTEPNESVEPSPTAAEVTKTSTEAPAPATYADDTPPPDHDCDYIDVDEVLDYLEPGTIVPSNGEDILRMSENGEGNCYVTVEMADSPGEVDYFQTMLTKSIRMSELLAGADTDGCYLTPLRLDRGSPFTIAHIVGCDNEDWGGIVIAVAREFDGWSFGCSGTDVDATVDDFRAGGEYRSDKTDEFADLCERMLARII